MKLLQALLVLSSVTMCIAQNDPWQPYELGNKKPPVVPEPATYVQVGAMLGLGGYLMYIRRKNKKSS